MQKPFSLSVAILTLAGILPFIASAALVFFADEFASLLKRDPDGARTMATIGRISLLAYGAVIVSFMTGIKWGSELSENRPALRSHVMSFAVLPSILAWIVLVVGIVSQSWMAGAMFILSGCFLLLLAWDLITEYPDWYIQLRVTATLMACASLIAVAFTVLR